MERLRVRTVANQTVTANNGTTHYVWDISGQIIAEVNGTTGVTQREMIYLDSMPLSAIDAVASPKKTYAVHVDHLNRPVMLTDAAKVNVWWASYESFGKVRATGGALTQNLGLPGQWFQLESGLAYNWHRHYDPTTGRYTTADPLGFVDGPSVFAYAGNGPHRMVDPTGQFSPLDVGLGVGLGYFFQPSNANAPGPNSPIIPNNDLAPFQTAGTAAICLSPHYWFSWRAGGGGVRVYPNGPGIDWHRFKLNGKMTNRPHYHSGPNTSQMGKHRPWQGGWK
jgi:RHS repeat-associated protein